MTDDQPVARWKVVELQGRCLSTSLAEGSRLMRAAGRL
jgi:hypothetical protein